jgi:hypothetical protein
MAALQSRERERHIAFPRQPRHEWSTGRPQSALGSIGRLVAPGPNRTYCRRSRADRIGHSALVGEGSLRALRVLVGILFGAGSKGRLSALPHGPGWREAVTWPPGAALP